MTIANHVSSLERKHRELKEAITREERRPGCDETQLAEMKKRKLLLKDEIQKQAQHLH